MKLLKTTILILAVYFSSGCIASESAQTPITTKSVIPTANKALDFAPTPSQIPIPISSKENNTIPSISYNSDWQNYFDQENGYSIALPQSWIYLDLGANDLEAMLSTHTDRYPELQTMYPPEFLKSLVVVGCKLIALDTKTEFYSSWSTLNILISYFPLDISFDEYLEYKISLLEKQFGGNTTINLERTFLGEIESGKLEYKSPLSSTQKAVMYQQYLILDGQMQYILTFTSEMESYGQNSPLFMDIAKSFRLLK